MLMGLALVIMILMGVKRDIIMVAARAVMPMAVVEHADMTDTGTVAPVAPGQAEHLRPAKRK